MNTKQKMGQNYNLKKKLTIRTGKKRYDKNNQSAQKDKGGAV